MSKKNSIQSKKIFKKTRKKEKIRSRNTLPVPVVYAALESTANGVVITNKKGNIEWVNKAFSLLTGYSFREVVGKNPKILKSGKQSAELYKELWTTILAGKVWHGEIVNKRKNGTLYTEEMTISPVVRSKGKPIHFIAIKQDVTKRKEAEEALRKSEEQYRLLFNSMIEGFCVIEVIFDEFNKPVDYRFLEINPAFEKQTGLHNAQGKLMRDLAPDHEAYWFEIYGNVALTGEPIRFENEAKELGFYYDVMAYHVGGPESHKVAILFSDITERKREEYIEKQRKLLMLIQQERLKNEFIADVTHEIRTPLAIIRGNLDLMARASNKNKSGNAEKFKSINEEIENLTILLSDLSLLSSKEVNAHDRKVNLKKTNFLKFFNGVTKKVKILALKKNISIKIKKIPNINIMGDNFYLERMFLNVIKNAITYGKENGWIVISITKNKNFLNISVKDNGIGISETEIPFIFDRFYRTDVARVNKHKGSGLGLSISKWVAEAHGGNIRVASKLGKGSTFIISLPIIPLKQ